MDGFSSCASCTKEKLLACKGIAREGFLIIEICVRDPFLDMLKSQELFTDLPSFSSARHCRAGPSKSSDYATGLKCLLSVVLSQALLFDSVFLSRTIIDKKESSSAVLDTRDDLPLWR